MDVISLLLFTGIIIDLVVTAVLLCIDVRHVTAKPVWTHMIARGVTGDGIYPLEEVRDPRPPPVVDHLRQQPPKSPESPLPGTPGLNLGQDRGEATRPQKLRPRGL